MSIDSELLRRLEYLALVVKKCMAGSLPGQTAGTGRGGAQEFRDHRRYAPGDELRYVDWNIYGRSERLYLKEFCREENVHLIIFLDRSSSMAIGDGEKFRIARQVAEALGFIAAIHFDAVSIFPFNHQIEPLVQLFRGRESAMKLMALLGELSPGGRTEFLPLAQFPKCPAGMTNVTFIISDFLSQTGYSETLMALMARRIRVNVVHVVSPSDFYLPECGNACVEDIESPESWHGAIDANLIRRYREHVENHRDALKRFCLAHGIGYCRAGVKSSLEHIIFNALRSASLLPK